MSDELENEIEPELLAFPCSECGHPFSDCDWGYEGEGVCNGERDREEFDGDEEGPFSCYCTRNPNKIEIDFLRAELASLRARPQEPGLSKEWLDERIREVNALYTPGIVTGPRLSDLRDAILENLAPSGPLSDPDDDLISIEAICEALHVHGDRAEAAFNTELAETYDSAIEIIQLRGPLSDEPREHVHEFGDWVIVGRTERRTCACGVYNHRPHPRRSVSDEPRELEWRWGSGEWLSTKTANGAIWTISEGHSLSVSADKYGRTTGMKDHGAHFDLYRGFENRDGDEYNSQGFVKECATLEEAQSLAARLQSVLDKQ